MTRQADTLKVEVGAVADSESRMLLKPLAGKTIVMALQLASEEPEGEPWRARPLTVVVEGLLRLGGGLLPPWLFEHPAAELSVDDSAQLCGDRRQPDHIA
jgi:hypothetical protein